MTNRNRFLLLVGIIGGFAMANAPSARAQFIETFDGGFDLVWNTDRFEPDIWTTVADFTASGKGDILKLGIDSSDHQVPGFTNYDSIGFYNTQGRQTLTPVAGGWSVSAEVYISPQMLTGAYDWRTDLWARNSTTGSTATETGASYWIIGASNIAVGPAENPSRIASFEIWTGTTNWLEIGAPIASSGWYSLETVYDGSSVSFFVNDTMLYTSAVAGAANLTTTFLQGANLPPPTSPFSEHHENYYWNGVAAIPEPSTYAALLGLVTLGLVTYRRIRKGKHPTYSAPAA